MSQKIKPRAYLDSSIFIAWLTDEKRKGNEMDGVYECFARIEEGKSLGIVASIIWAEVLLDNRYPEEKKHVFRTLLSGRKVQEVSADRRVNQLAGKLIDHYVQEHKRDGSKKLGTLDAIHLAAAIHYKVDVFYTFDDGKKENTRSLLSISGNVAGHNLRIEQPPPSYRLLP